jgi:pimeloyl-ACP methyl ester carboxylesterase
MPNDYLTELEHFNKKWLAIFGEVDRVVPTNASIKNIEHYMSISGNKDYNIAVLPNCGHAPVDVDTKQMVDFHYLIINWLKEKCFQ